MAWISEIHYINTLAESLSVSEYVEIALSPTEQLRAGDFVFAAYESNGAFRGSVALNTLTPAIDPDNGHFIYRVNIRVTDPDAIAPIGSALNESEAIALLDISLPSPVLSFYDIGGGVQNITANGGPAAGAVSQNIPAVSGQGSIQFDRSGNRIDGPITPNRAVICFAKGTLIDTAQGAVPVETLKIGDLLRTATGEICKIRWIGARHVQQGELQQNPKLYPVRIGAGAMGSGLPERDLVVSRQHRIVVSSDIAEQVTGSRNVLIPAIKLTALPDVYVDERLSSIDYFHILFEEHKILCAEGAQAESLFPGPQALQALTSASRDEIYAVFPELAKATTDPQTAHFVPDNKQQKAVIAQHVAQGLPLQQCQSDRRRAAGMWL
ncbi:Hint domain-containing protein [Shimia sp. R11_0]|uniref:Hint domain-containing protein n=1 Tax=Shimia sp. R11_0 TaxID=2821096 RepID=UPI001ADA9B5A|nr:Hint domain-containing protein [Shimia sp. R11_0]MBO9479325.1 Hint domain-containing protein [Shimia sp. R11_0]